MKSLSSTLLLTSTTLLSLASALPVSEDKRGIRIPYFDFVRPGCTKYYWVIPGDTCWSVSIAHDITIDQLIAWNAPLSCPESLWANTAYCVGFEAPAAAPTEEQPRPTQAPATTQAPPEPTQYVPPPKTGDACWRAVDRGHQNPIAERKSISFCNSILATSLSGPANNLPGIGGSSGASCNDAAAVSSACYYFLNT